MAEFSISSIEKFQIPDLGSVELEDTVADLGQARRREILFSSENRTELEWMARAAEYYHDDGLTGDSDRYSSHLGIAALESGNNRYLARAYLWQLVCAILTRKDAKLKRRLIQVQKLEQSSQDPYAKAVRMFAQSLAVQRGYPWDPTWSNNDWCEIFVSYKVAAELFEQCGDFDMAIWARIEYGNSMLALGRYITAIEWIESALQIASQNSAWRFTGRMLESLASAAIDQGYRTGLATLLQNALSWCEFVGDEAGRISCLISSARLLTFEIPPGTTEGADEPARLISEASARAKVAGFLWHIQKADEASVLLRKKCEIRASQKAPSYATEQPLFLEELPVDVYRKMNSRLEDGIADSADGFFIFTALRNDEFVCRDFLNDYRNLTAARLVGKSSTGILIYSEYRENPFLQGLSHALCEAADKRATYDDLIEVQVSGERHWFRRRLTPSGDGAVLKLRNVTAERQVEDALKQAAETARRSERLMSEFLANMSHEIRTPVSGIIGLARMLSETPLDDAQSGYIRDIVTSGDGLLELIRDVLDLSKLDSGFITIEPESVMLHDLAASTVRLYKGQAAERGIALRYAIQDAVPTAVTADGTRLRQILTNLIGNALKFTSEGYVSLSLETDGDEVRFVVSDTGMGIPEEDLHSIFDRYHQSPHSSKRVGGSGLGLAISKRLIELMSGTIEVESEVGKGSTFVVRLRLPKSEAPNAKVAPVVPVRFDGIRVLLAEDNEVNRIVSEHFLTKLGCQVAWAADGSIALELFETDRPDIVFMDVRMPVLDGLEATQEIRRREQLSGRHTPIVALTAGALIEERMRCFDAGMDDYLTKPFTDEALRSILAKWAPRS